MGAETRLERLEESFYLYVKQLRALSMQLKLLLKKERRYLILADEEPQLYHRPFSKDAYGKFLDAQLTAFDDLRILIKASASLPVSLSTPEKQFLRFVFPIVLQMRESTTKALSEAKMAFDSLIKLKNK